MRIRIVITLCFTAILVSTISLIACEPSAPFKIKNDTNQTLNIFIAFTNLEHVDERDMRIPIGSVEPGQILEPEGLIGASLRYLIEAKDSGGNIVYSKEFSVKELMKNKWKVVISVSK